MAAGPPSPRPDIRNPHPSIQPSIIHLVLGFGELEAQSCPTTGAQAMEIRGREGFGNKIGPDVSRFRSTIITSDRVSRYDDKNHLLFSLRCYFTTISPYVEFSWPMTSVPSRPIYHSRLSGDSSSLQCPPLAKPQTATPLTRRLCGPPFDDQGSVIAH